MTSGWMYMKVPAAGQEQWMKMKLDEQLWNNQDQFTQQINFLESALNVTKLNDEKVNGVDCYVIEVNPDMATLMDWIASQGQSTGELENINPDMFKTISIKEWIAKDGLLPQKSAIDILMEMTPADISSTDSSSPPDFEKTTITMTGTVNYFDYDKPVSIVLPPESAGAREINSSLQKTNPY
jgi:hypothetical protein